MGFIADYPLRVVFFAPANANKLCGFALFSRCPGLREIIASEAGSAPLLSGLEMAAAFKHHPTHYSHAASSPDLFRWSRLEGAPLDCRNKSGKDSALSQRARRRTWPAA